ncbi:hypothetical protein OIDMADRAFT_30935 [Oidiodendron maius Zn]|uniref:C2H2-type domain-containing protein n=1 Tax=Oidiodendron maius (strain Zn) TaxID=913774 RepID=A0A0C3DBL5_OIDMZ|nr:hypothetical protein OIDMADRAFT_30935 [Oidiodendron maius Zn]
MLISHILGNLNVVNVISMFNVCDIKWSTITAQQRRTRNCRRGLLNEGLLRRMENLVAVAARRRIRQIDSGGRSGSGRADPLERLGLGLAAAYTGQKRQRYNDEGDEDFDSDGKRDPKRPKIESPPNVSQEKRRFACPDRKHDPRTYCHQIRCWRPCALTPLETIARVKSLVSLSSNISVPCPRCKVLHTNEDELKNHVLEVKGCEVKEGQPVEGITSDIEKQLKSRKKTHRDQLEVMEGERATKVSSSDVDSCEAKFYLDLLTHSHCGI